MPALFAYVISLCLLIGGGVSALNWLTTPEPVKLAAKKKSKAKPLSYAAIAEITGSPSTRVHEAASEVTASDQSKIASRDDLSRISEGVNAITVVESAPQRHDAAQTSDQPTQSAFRNEISETTSSGNKTQLPAGLTGSDDPNAGRVAKTRKEKLYRRQANNRFDKRKLAVMTLRTIEFPDGRRVTRLISYQGRDQALAFRRDE